MDKIKEIIKTKASEIFEESVSIRRYLHQNPELSFEEKETSKFISNKLSEYNISHKTEIAGYGILGKIEGTLNGTNNLVIALRADMDALPIKEQNSFDFKSVNDGVMHACGHDFHSASLLGTAKILSDLKHLFAGTVLLLFQPAEERIPGGAKLMLEAGVFNDLQPDIVIGQHVMPSMEAGTVGFKPGKYMASSDEVFITVKGKGGHAAMPYDINDTVLIASHIIVALQQIVSRHAKASIPSVLSFGKVIADGAVNVIPDEVKIEGTFRTMNEEWRAEAKDKIRLIATSIAEGMGASCEVEIKHGYPFLVNDNDITSRASSFAKNYFKEDEVIDMDIRMTAEDFAYFSQKYPSCFYRVGTGNKTKGITSPLHSSTFNVDEEALKHGSGFMAWMAISFLNRI